MGLIPARGGSRRVPGKNLAVLGGRTLVRRALDTCLASGAFDTVALSSESRDILKQADPVPAVRQVARPQELATDSALSFDVLLHALDVLERERERPFDAAAIVQCTVPFAAPDDLTAAVRHLERSEAGSVVSVAPVESHHHPLKLKQLEGDRLLPWLADDAMVPSQDLPVLFVRNGAIYVSRREILAAGRFIAEDVRGIVMPPERSIDVDTPLDLAFAEFLLDRTSN